LQAAFAGIKVEYRTVDLISEASIKAMFESITDPLDVLVNNGGYLSKPENFVHADLKEWWRGFEVNVLGTAVFTQQFLQNRAKQGANEQAVIINMNSLGALNVLAPLLSGYSGSKSALWRMMEVISMDLQDKAVLPGGARVISIHPGFVETAMAAKSGLDGMFQPTDGQLAADFVVWSTTQEASFLANRLAFVNWDVEELLEAKEEILAKDKLRTGMS
jgi:NAD(P)-dependent dehydrogenase (short-subunit alcohol dehydrogenase family)